MNNEQEFQLRKAGSVWMKDGCMSLTCPTDLEGYERIDSPAKIVRVFHDEQKRRHTVCIAILNAAEHAWQHAEELVQRANTASPVAGRDPEQTETPGETSK